MDYPVCLQTPQLSFLKANSLKATEGTELSSQDLTMGEHDYLLK